MPLSITSDATRVTRELLAHANGVARPRFASSPRFFFLIRIQLFSQCTPLRGFSICEINCYSGAHVPNGRKKKENHLGELVGDPVFRLHGSLIALYRAYWWFFFFHRPVLDFSPVHLWNARTVSFEQLMAASRAVAVAAFPSGASANPIIALLNRRGVRKSTVNCDAATYPALSAVINRRPIVNRHLQHAPREIPTNFTDARLTQSRQPARRKFDNDSLVAPLFPFVR